MPENDDYVREGIRANRAFWDEVAPLHETSEFYDLEGFRRGRNDIRPFEVDEVGDVAGKRLIHLQCHIGTDTLSWARRGAHVVGLDFSANSIAAARRLAAASEIDAEFVCAEVFDAVGAVGGRTFDIVYTGIGALGWLPDLAPWAHVVNELLVPGGFLYVLECHPLVLGLDDAGRTLEYDIYEGTFERLAEEGGTYAAPEANVTNFETYERAFSISEVLTPLLDLGLTIEMFHEQSFTNAARPFLEHGADGFYRLPAGAPRFPLTYSLRARKPGGRGR